MAELHWKMLGRYNIIKKISNNNLWIEKKNGVENEKNEKLKE